MAIEFIVDEQDVGVRLDRFLNKHYPIQHSLLQKLLRQGKVRVDQKKCQANLRLELGQIIKVPPIEAREDETVKGFRVSERTLQEASKFVKNCTIFEDDEMMVMNKPAGLAVQGGTNTREHVDGYMRVLFPENPPKLVHRLDKETSGLLLLAKTSIKARELTAAFKEKMIQKTYLAITKGVPDPFEGTINAPLSKEMLKGFEKVMVDEENGVFAKTEFEVIDFVFKKFALLKLAPLTGRTHQLRAHMEHLGVPILGDDKYGEWTPEKLPLHLHAWKIEFTHKGKKAVFEAPVPSHLISTMKEYGLNLK